MRSGGTTNLYLLIPAAVATNRPHILTGSSVDNKGDVDDVAGDSIYDVKLDSDDGSGN